MSAEVAVSWFRPIVKLWHQRAYPVIGTKPFEATWSDFINGLPQVQFPKGQGAMSQLLADSDAAPPPACASDYQSPRTTRLIKLCRELQRAAGEGLFFLACRTAGELLEMDHRDAAGLLKMLVVDGVLSIHQAHTSTHATRYRYLGGD